MGGVEDFYVHTATITPYLGKNGYGADMYGTPVPVTGFWDGGQHLTRTAAGENVLAAGTFYTTPNVPIKTDDRFEYGTTHGRVVGVDSRNSGPLGLPDHLAATII